MWCSNTSCGIEGTGRFCKQCGARMVEKRCIELLIICNRQQEDGSICPAELVPNQRFCNNCGGSVDPDLFSSAEQGRKEFYDNKTEHVKVIVESEHFEQLAGRNAMSSERQTGDTRVTMQDPSNNPVTVGFAQCSTNIDTGNVKPNSDQNLTTPSDGSGKLNSIESANNDVKRTSSPEITTEDENLTASLHVSPELRDKISQGNDVEMQAADGSNSDEGGNTKIHQNKIEDQIIIPTIESADILGKLRQVQLENNDRENLNIKSTKCDQSNLLESTNQDINKNLDYDTSLKNECGKTEETDAMDYQSMDYQSVETTEQNSPENGQIKRNKKQKKNKKKRKRDREEKLSASNDVPTPRVIDSSDVQDTTSKSDALEDKTQARETENGNETNQMVFGGGSTWGVQETNQNDFETVPSQTSSLFDISYNKKNIAPHSLSNEDEYLSKQENENEDSIQDTPVYSKEKDVDMNDDHDNDDGDDPADDNNDTTKSDEEPKLSRRMKRNQKSKEQKSAKSTENVKDAKENKNRVVSKTKLEKTESTAGTGKTEGPDEETHVHFHVLVSGDHKFDPEKHKLILRIEDAKGNWDDKSHVCKVKKKLANDVFEMEIIMKIPTSQISRKKANYKYCIYKCEKDKYVWEHYIKNNTSGIGCNRTIIIQGKWKNLDIWHQYDGFVEKEPSTWREKISNYIFDWTKDLSKHAKTSVEYFARAILEPEETKYSLTLVLEQLEILLSCTKKIYFFDAKCWDHYTEKDFKSEMGSCLVGLILDSLTDLTELECVWNEVRERQVTMAVTVVFAANKFDVPLHEFKQCQKVCNVLLPRPDLEKKRCYEMTVVEKYFQEKSDGVKMAFETLAVNLAEKTRNPSWLYLMPWIHFMFGWCAPFDVPGFDVGHDKIEPLWWGLTKRLETAVKYFVGKTTKWDIPGEQIIGFLLPMFEVDYLLPRTFITTIQLNYLMSYMNTKTIPIEVCLASLISFIRKTRPRYSSVFGFGYITTDENKVFECISGLTSILPDILVNIRSNEDQTKLQSVFASQLLIESTKTNRVDTFMKSVHVLLQCLANQTVEKKTTCDDAMKILQRCVLETISWMEIYCSHWNRYETLEEGLMFWNNIYAPENLASDAVANEWNAKITTALKERLEKKVCNSHTMTNFVQLYCQKLDRFNVTMQDCMSKTAFKAIEKGYTIAYEKFNHNEIERFGRLLSDLFLREWNKNVKSDDENEILLHLLRWPPVVYYVKIYSEQQDKMGLLSARCVEQLICGVSVIESCVNALVDGEITVGNLQLIQTKDVNFPELARLVKLKGEHSSEFISKTIQIRQKEMEAFSKQAELMTKFISLCQHLGKIDTAAVDSTLKKQENIGKHKVMEFCVPAEVSAVDNIETFQPNLCAFEVSEQVLETLSEMKRCSASNMFMMLWTNQCHSLQEPCSTLNDVLTVVWHPVKNRWEMIAKRITSGEMTFIEFEKVLGHIYREDYEQMREELKKLGVLDKTARKRLDQLRQFRQLNICAKGAKVILTFAKDFGLTGNFQQIQIIALNSESNVEMRFFNDSIMDACDFLTELTDERANCLFAFVSCRNLVQWLMDSMKKAGLKELKVFVDLAFMSAGDEPINIARVQCLHSAVTGYAPLIFDLKPTSGYEQLLKHCAVVWKELDANPNLPDMLLDTNRQLEWLKEIKKAHGSVEVTSLMQTEAINGNGIYTVGKNAWKHDAQKHNNDSLLTVTDVVQLTVPENEGNTLLRNYTLSQLQDLQSRLMLVAGRAEKCTDSVDRFTMVFDNITRLSNVYLKLCTSGCVLFKDFTARFLCDPCPERPVCIFLNFGQGDATPPIKGRRTPNEDLKEMIPELAKFLETCLEEWLYHIKDKRRTYLHLNYFTVDQLVILQRELVKIGTEEQPSHLIYPLLSAVKTDCTPDDLHEAMARAKEEIENEFAMETAEDDTSDGGLTENPTCVTIDEKRQRFISELKEAGYDEALAIRALEVVDPEDVTQGIVWCMDNETSAMSDDRDQAPVLLTIPDREEPKPVFSGWSQAAMDIQTIITTKITGLKTQSESGSKPLMDKLSTLWKMFLESISSHVRDYLSLEHLGIILRCLSSKNKEEVSRTLPPGFCEGQPNLVICPSADVLLTTLSIYMMDKDQPLPQSDEVLMCTPSTTKDEVDIFWRRAIFDSGRKIHCLLNADMLDYDISEGAERRLEEYLQDVHYKDVKYRLIVICGSDNEYRSGIVSSLDKFKRQLLMTSISHLRDYLLNKLTVNERTVDGIKPAASVDRDRSSVRVIKSWRAGVGKTLFKKRTEEELSLLKRDAVHSEATSIPLQEKNIDLHELIARLLKHVKRPGEIAARIFHIDVSHEVQNGVDYLLFNLLILGCLIDKTGFVWRKSPTDIYLIETMPLMMQAANRRVGDLQYVHAMLGVLPDLTCRSPQESLRIYQGQKPRDFKDSDQLFDDKQFRSEVFQRTFQYLHRLDQGRQLGDVCPHNAEGTPQICLQTLLRHCGLTDPSWSELHHFVWFLNTQLVDFEQNSFVSVAAAEDLPGFTKFVLRFLITMSRDFSTRSLDMKEESPSVRVDDRHTSRRDDEMDYEEGERDELQAYQMRRTWESSPHPYLFFNSDRFTFTFLGFFIDRATGNLIDSNTRIVLETGIMAQNLYDSLVRNNAPMQENFDAIPRDQKIMKLCNVMGIEFPHDPDDTYELTTDNVKKIMAIYMRFRCDIPVIIMGETGCGKTRLVKFMCALQVPPGADITNMILMKVHGGTTNTEIIRKVREAEEIARKNREQYGQHMYTVLFFDEANTTESIGLIKEIMCDKCMEGNRLTLCENLKIVAACNPYRKHSEQLIRKLEQAGLGYHVDAEETTDRLGRVPMRRLVYRVQPLPQSLLPLVWDFGQLNTLVEDLYIRQMVKRYIREDRLPDTPNLKETVSAILTASQEYMRAQKDECSFVSLRDVDRVLTVMSWFFEQSKGDRTLFNLMDDKFSGAEKSDLFDEDDEENDDEEINRTRGNHLDDITRSLILALGLCYHACLRTRAQYRAHVARFFVAPYQLQDGADQIRKEIECCQEVFLDHVHLEKNIAKNMALKENVFMMVVCIELRIPLFLVGKPGSSKSLAKTIVSDAMQGNAARNELFRELKQAQMVSFQCSPLSTPDGIMGTFRQCAQFQKDKDLDTFVSIVVLDEVGLAEDSPRMPLKTLHPLLEDGCQGDEKPEKHKKVAFIGISNWALDPAKMNRGILVQREVPDLEELQNSASGICHIAGALGSLIAPLIEPMAISYLEIFKEATDNMREFYGLRDFYSLVKMVYSFVERSKQPPSWHEMLHAIKRNFGGLDQVDPVKYFRKNFATIVHLDAPPLPKDPDCSPSGLIQACLFDKKNESRYLLLLTENYGALSIIQQQILSRGKDIHPITIFGSSFRSDQEYTQVCRNINKIKVCMETGNTVVLLNLENLYESLYDALNQYYVYFGGERYVDLGLGTHRVKCPVHKNFRLIVVAEKQTVYKKFPIPLINRLEKHFLTINTMLNPEQHIVVRKLEEWAQDFVTQKQSGYRREKETTKLGDVFIGYHDDTCSAIVLDVWEKHQHLQDMKDREEQVFQEAKSALLWCATPESVMKLENTYLSIKEKKMLNQEYFHRQQHESLIQYLEHFIGGQNIQRLLIQVTTHSKLLAGTHRFDISRATGITVERILLLETLSSFDTEQQFTNRIQQHIQSSEKKPSLMVIQCDSGDVNANLIACARYCVRDEIEKRKDDLRAPLHVVFIVQLPRGANFTGFQCGVWKSAHIDDLYTPDMNMPTLHDMQERSVARIFLDAVTEPSEMEVDNDDENKPVPSGEEMEWANLVQTAGSDLDVDMKYASIQLDDVVLDLENVDESQRHSVSRPVRLNVKGLILNCVQAALSMVKDKVENSVREIDRVPLLLKLLHQDSSPGRFSFLRGVCLIIARLLKEKESKNHSVGMAQHWLINEAASNESIKKAGTFRRSCIQTLEGKVSPILAGIIAYLDTNENLSILEETQLSWKQELWLKFLNSPNVINLQLADILSPARQSDLQEVFVMTTGCEGHIFRSRMPFSWLIMSQISEILKLRHVTAGLQDNEGDGSEIEDRVSAYLRVLSDHPMGRVLSEVTEEQQNTDVADDYIQDFVHTVYNATSEHEHQLVVQSVYFKSSQMGKETSLLERLIHVHIAHETLAPRLIYFRAMNSVWPQCSSVIIELKATKPDHFMFQENDFTFSALCLLIENLTPKGTDLNSLPGRSKWLRNVHKYRPVVEKVLGLHSEDPRLYGSHTFNSVRRARNLWSRVVVVKLFLEHVCTTDKEDKITIKYCMPLWTILGEETDLKDIKSLDGVEKFLKGCNKVAVKEYLGSEEKCCLCELPLEGPPITLPCKDVLCDQCYDGMISLGENTCSKCQESFAEGWEPTKETANKTAVERLKEYQKRCNAFLMDIVSQLCFAENTAPSQEVINKLLGYIFFTTRASQYRTRDLTIFETGVDPNPVFRSFLLQLLMRTSEDSVLENLDRYLQQAERFIRKDQNEKAHQYVELSLLVIQCLEDKFTQEASCADIGDVHYATQALYRANTSVDGEELTVQKLYGIASARTGLAIVAQYVAEIVMKQIEPRSVDHRLRKMIEAANILCDNAQVKWYRVYFVKYLCRSYGIEVYQTICRNPASFLRWIPVREINRQQVLEVSDRFIVCGERYKELREAVTKVVLGDDDAHLLEKLQELHTAGVRVEPMLQLALYREVTSSNLYPQQQRKITTQILQNLDELLSNCQLVRDKQLLKALVYNQLVPGHNVIQEAEDLVLQGIQCLSVHFLTVMAHFQGDGTLLQPLITLMKMPQLLQNAFLPTMPQDDLDEVREALLAGRHLIRVEDENPVIYRCPNGHPYVIGNCGRPAVVGNCKDCGAAIGGESHVLRPGNIKDAGTDATLAGHILGRAQARGRDVRPERQLTPAYCSAVRMLLHIAMYHGSGTNMLGVQNLIKPNIAPNDVEDYVWDHITRDLEDMQSSLGLSVDDVLLLMHSVVDTIFRMHNEGDRVNMELSQWNSKQGRREWEIAFCAKFIQPVFQDLNRMLKTHNQQLAHDQRLGADPLLCLLYETDTNSETENAAMIEQIPRVWRYRTQISIQHLRQEVQTKVRHDHHKILQLFLHEEPNLRAMRYIPSILRLHRALFQKYQKKLDKAEASQITVAQLRKEEIAGVETNLLLQDFAVAWELVRRSLERYLCPTEIGATTVAKEYCQQKITDKTPVAMLLPTMKEAGMCSFALLDFLFRKQNDFLDKYLKEVHRKSANISTIHPREVTSAHLISYDPQHDIFPLILANCQYFFEMGKGTKIEYDFAGLEKQLMDRFLFSKSRIDVGTVLQIYLMTYRTEFTNAEVFRKLAYKIPQESLSTMVKNQISGEFRSLPDLCQSLDNLDITISFLKSTGGLSDKRLHEFMLETLRMESSLHSQKAQQTCEFRHAQSLWLLLSLQRSKKMTESHQSTESIFESVSAEFHEVLPEELYNVFKEYALKKLTVEKLTQLVEVLHQFILLVVAVRQNIDDEDYTDTTNNKLCEWLCGYIDSLDFQQLEVACLVDFPKEILYKHSVYTWVSAYKFLKQKQTGDYKTD